MEFACLEEYRRHVLRRVIVCGLLLAVLLSQARAALSATICRWTDENGHVQLAETAPPQSRGNAICIDAHQYELTPLQQRDADERNAALQAQLRAAELAREASAAPAPMPPVRAASAPIVKRPLEKVDENTDCASWWRLYDESSECFGSYRSVGGGIKPEALEQCNVIASPEVACGPRRN